MSLSQGRGGALLTAGERRSRGRSESDFVQSLQRGLAVIRAFDAEHPALTLSEVARVTGLARAAARRFLLTLVELGYMRVEEGRLFRLSPRVLELGRPYLASLTLPEIAKPHLADLVVAVRESATVAVLDDDEIVYVEHVPAKRIMSIQITVGDRDPAYATSLGRVLLAGQGEAWLEDYWRRGRFTAITPRTIAAPERLRSELGRVRRQGFALVDQELEEGLRALAAPILDEHGSVVAAVNVAVHTSRWSVEAIRHELLPRLLETAKAIQHDLAASAQRPAAVALAVQPAVPSHPGAAGARESDFVQSLQRGLAVIRAFDAEHPALTLSEVARVTGLARAAARRFLLTLVELGYMRVEEGRLFRLSPRVLELGRPYLASLTLPEIAKPHLADLVVAVRESATVAVLDDDEIVYVEHVPAKRIMSIQITVGDRDPAYATSLGRVLLAGQGEAWLEDYWRRGRFTAITPRTIAAPERLRSELGRVRRQGFALVDQELEEGLRALAAPILDEHGSVVAAVNVAVHTSRWSVEAIRHELLPRLLETAKAIQHDLAATGRARARIPAGEVADHAQPRRPPGAPRRVGAGRKDPNEP